MAKKSKSKPQPPTPAWAVYLRTSSDENQKPELSRERQRFLIIENVLKNSDMPVHGEYFDVLTGTTPNRDDYQRMLSDARAGKFSHVIVERADRFGRNDTEALRAIDELAEFGVAVRFADQPELDPLDPDDRVFVALKFTLARRESKLLGIRVCGGLYAKERGGGHINRAPDGYLNLSAEVEPSRKKDLGRIEHWVELDKNRAHIWREAWELLLTDKYTLDEIAEVLHARNYRYRSGRPFVQVNADGERVRNSNTMSSIFHNWLYAGWIVSEARNYAPKMLRGNWEAMVSTEDFERGLAILERRNRKRTLESVQEYLLTGLLFYQASEGEDTFVRLTGSTSNSGRTSGGSPYYRVAKRGGVSFSCSSIDEQVAAALEGVQVDPAMLPLIRAAYTDELHQRVLGSVPKEREQLDAALKQIETEERRMARLYAMGKIDDDIWNDLWSDWRDRKTQVRRALETLQLEREIHIDNLETALEIIARIGTLYNGLECSDQKDLLHQVVERVVVNQAGHVRLELRSPFAYLKELTDDVQQRNKRQPRPVKHSEKNESAGDDPGAPGADCSNLLFICGKYKTQPERETSLKPSEFIHQIAFPQQMRVICTSIIETALAIR